jgi:hypothetical protein
MNLNPIAIGVILKVLILLMISFAFLSSCDNDFSTKSKIDPFAPSNKLGERYGNKVTIKIPLSESSIGYFDIEEILGNDNLNRESRSFLKSVWDNFKLKLFNIGVGFGFSNKVKFTSYFDFPRIDQDLIKSAVVKRVFFTTEDCRKADRNCNANKKFSSNFTLIDKMFVNISNYDSIDPDEKNTESIATKKFDKIAKKSFAQEKADITRLMNSYAIKGSETIAFDENQNTYDEINLVKFSSLVPYMKVDFSKVPEEARTLRFEIKDKVRRKAITNYLKSISFKKLLKKVDTSGDYIYADLRKKAKPQDVFEVISSEQSPTVTKMIILRLNSKYRETKKFFGRDKFKPFIKDSTMIGRSLYIELNDADDRVVFLDMIDEQNDFKKINLDIYKMDSCIHSNCIDLEVEKFNLVPLLAVNPQLRIDSYISIKALGRTDFKYNGFIEVEVELSLPL